MSKRGTSILLDETIYSIRVFKINGFFFVLLKDELPNNSASENLESFRFKILLSVFQMLFMRIILLSEKEGSEGSSEWLFQHLSTTQIFWVVHRHIVMEILRVIRMCLNRNSISFLNVLC